MLEEITYKALSKFQVLQEPLQNAPNRCCGCGRYSSGDANKPLEFVDMGFSLEFLGEVFICVDGCFREIMNQLGVLTREQTLRIEAKLEEFETQNKLLTEENKEYKDAMGSITRAIDAGLRRSSVESPASVIARAENEPVLLTRISEKSSGGKKGSPKQTDERGSSDLPNNEGDELLGDI